MSLPTVLIVDDEIRSLEALRRTLEEDFTVFTASNVDAALEILRQEFIQIIVCDQRMPVQSGVTFLKHVRADWPDVVRIMLSGYTDTEDIIAGINEAGIFQYLLKPWQPEQLMLVLRSAADVYRLQLENQRLSLELRDSPALLAERVANKRQHVREKFSLDRVARAPDSPLNATCEMIDRIAPYDISVLITGESGTGKELLAHALHYRSGRAAQAFVTQNCGALPDALLEAELFGYKRGAFTGAYSDRVGLFQQADGGTIFLDEIGETTPSFQVKLLRVLQEGEIRPLGSPRSVQVNVRVIAATNRDLEEEVRAGRLRQDLYYRIANLTMHLPPLRERPMDIPLIAEGLLQRAMRQLNRKVRGFTPETLDCFKAYRWPGNVRELQNEILRILALTDSEWLEARLLSPKVLRAAMEESEEQQLDLLAGLDGSLKDRMEQLEARLIRETLIRHRWNKTHAAQELGLSRVGLRSKLVRYGMDKA